MSKFNIKKDFPISHLFEMALEGAAKGDERKVRRIIQSLSEIGILKFLAYSKEFFAQMPEEKVIKEYSDAYNLLISPHNILILLGEQVDFYDI